VPIARRAAPSEMTATQARAAPAEARAPATEATITWSSCENWSSQYGREKATQEKF